MAGDDTGTAPSASEIWGCHPSLIGVVSANPYKNERVAPQQWRPSQDAKEKTAPVRSTAKDTPFAGRSKRHGGNNLVKTVVS